MRHLPKIVMLGLLWGGLIYMVIEIDPARVKNIIVPGLYLPFVGWLGMTVCYSALLAAKSLKFAVLLSLVVLVGVTTMIMRWMNWIVGAAEIGMLIVLSLTLIKQS